MDHSGCNEDIKTEIRDLGSPWLSEVQLNMLKARRDGIDLRNCPIISIPVRLTDSIKY
jgi:hypothetical protein